MVNDKICRICGYYDPYPPLPILVHGNRSSFTPRREFDGKCLIDEHEVRKNDLCENWNPPENIKKKRKRKR